MLEPRVGGDLPTRSGSVPRLSDPESLHLVYLLLLSDPEQRVRGAVGRQQPPGRHGRADRQHGGQNELHSVLA